MDSVVKPITDKPADYIRDPYPYFAGKRRARRSVLRHRDGLLQDAQIAGA